jgi:hypothetical protein
LEAPHVRIRFLIWLLLSPDSQAGFHGRQGIEFLDREGQLPQDLGVDELELRLLLLHLLFKVLWSANGGIKTLSRGCIVFLVADVSLHEKLAISCFLLSNLYRKNRFHHWWCPDIRLFNFSRLFHNPWLKLRLINRLLHWFTGIWCHWLLNWWQIWNECLAILI